MKREIACYGCRKHEKETFEKLGQKYNYRLILNDQLLTNDNYQDAFGYEIIMIRGNCFLDSNALKNLKEHGLKYILTRTVGFNHLDLDTCQELEIEVANVPNYSPYAVAELVITFAMMLLRNISYITNRTSNGNFTINEQMFSKEIRNCVVGIIGCGKIGKTVARLFNSLGAKVIGYDVNLNQEKYEYIELLPLDDVIKSSDIITLHLAYVKGLNDNFINRNIIDQMKTSAILINTSRGEVLDLNSALQAVKVGKLAGLAIDVIKCEKELFFKNWDKTELIGSKYQELIDLYPKVLVTPHIGSSTDRALQDMVEISLKNMDEYIVKGKCQNSLIKSKN